MPIGLLGKKLGMTHVYDPHGRRMTVTAIQVGPCTVLQLREPARDGYHAVQLGFEPIEESKVTKPVRGQFKKAGTGPFRYVKEFRVPAAATPSPEQPNKKGQGEKSEKGGKTEKSETSENDEQAKEEQAGNASWTVGQELTVDLFSDYELVDVTGTAIGRGFQGGGKRHGWSGGPKSHGSMSHRAPGSIGAGTSPGRVLRGRNLPGHMGTNRVTVQNVRVVRRDAEHHLLLVEGAIPGAERELIMVSKSVKRPGVVRKPEEIETVVEEVDKKSKGAAKAAKAAKKK